MDLKNQGSKNRVIAIQKEKRPGPKKMSGRPGKLKNIVGAD